MLVNAHTQPAQDSSTTSRVKSINKRTRRQEELKDEMMKKGKREQPRPGRWARGEPGEQGRQTKEGDVSSQEGNGLRKTGDPNN